jgi:putative transposase
MPRSARIVIPQIPHHICQRGNRRDDVFLDDSDRITYLDIIQKQCARFGLMIHGYCLMSNHVHLVATPSMDDSLAKAVGQAHHLYSKAFNMKYNQVGHAWHSRFYSCPLDNSHLVSAMLYVDRNPVRAGLVGKPWEWKWSSASAHLGETDKNGLLDFEWWSSFAQKTSWKKLIQLKQNLSEIEEIRSHTQSGRPLGSEEFINHIESILGYPVRLNPRGRPKIRK